MFDYFSQISAIREEGRAERARIEHETNERIREIHEQTETAKADIKKFYDDRGVIIDEIGKAAEVGDTKKMQELLNKLHSMPEPEFKSFF